MQTTFVIFTQGPFVFVGYVYPFTVMFRGGSLEPTIKRVWLWLFLYIVFLCFFVPRIAANFDPELGKDIRHWVPDTPVVVPITVMGWLFPLIGGGFGFIVRYLSLRCFPQWTKRISFVAPRNESDGTDATNNRDE